MPDVFDTTVLPEPGTPGEPGTPLALETRHLTKVFGGLVADDDVSLSVRQGEVHALLGENGAGKTTLMNMCFGLLVPDSGQIVVGGEPVAVRSPLVARRLGLGMVHQHFKLVPSLTVTENIFLGVETSNRAGGLDRKGMIRSVTEVAERFGLELRPTDTVGDLSAGAQQRVEILKALYFEARVLILDEPTAVLTPQETVGLFSVMRDLAESGRSVIIITHRLREVIEVSDRYSVMRRGRLVATGLTAEATERKITVLMVGREVDLGRSEAARLVAPEVTAALDCRSLSVRADDGRTVLDDVSLRVRRGEIVGIAGVEGNGQTELVEALAGLRATSAGEIRLETTDISRAGPAERRHCGLAHIPEDRLATGVYTGGTVAENIAGGFFDSNLFAGGFYKKGFTSKWVEEVIERYDIRGASPTTRVQALSGGNMQKLVVAREIETNPAVLLAAQPTRGVDIGATEFIHAQLRDLRHRGTGVLLLSADLGELLALSDRILVMYRGAIAGEYPASPDQITNIGLAMAGATEGPTDDIDVATVIDASPPDEWAQPRVSAAASLEVPVRATELRLLGSHEGGTGRAERQPAQERMRGWLRTNAPAAGSALTQPSVAVLIALIIGFFTVLGTGKNPVSAYHYFILGSFMGEANFSAMISQLEPLLIVGVSVYLCFRGGVFNIGAEGQLYIGAFVGALVAFTFTGLPGPLLIVLSMLAGAVGGALWALLPGLLYAFYDVNIIVTTLMFNYIAMYLTAYLVAGPFFDPGAGSAETKMIAGQAHLPQILGIGGADIGVFVGLGLLVVTAVVLGLTRWGMKARFVGGNARFAQSLGIGVRSKVIELMLLSGGIAGIAGVVESLGTQFRFNQTFSPGYGFLGLTVALLGRLTPLGVLLAALVYAVLEAGAATMQLNVNTPLALVQLLEGIIVILMTATALRFGIRRRARQGSALIGEPGIPGLSELEEADR